jgi:hypothetical protein
MSKKEVTVDLEDIKTAGIFALLIVIAVLTIMLCAKNSSNIQGEPARNRQEELKKIWDSIDIIPIQLYQDEKKGRAFMYKGCDRGYIAIMFEGSTRKSKYYIYDTKKNVDLHAVGTVTICLLFDIKGSDFCFKSKHSMCKNKKNSVRENKPKSISDEEESPIEKKEQKQKERKANVTVSDELRARIAEKEKNVRDRRRQRAQAARPYVLRQEHLKKLWTLSKNYPVEIGERNGMIFLIKWVVAYQECSRINETHFEMGYIGVWFDKAKKSLTKYCAYKTIREVKIKPMGLDYALTLFR